MVMICVASREGHYSDRSGNALPRVTVPLQRKLDKNQGGLSRAPRAAQGAARIRIIEAVVSLGNASTNNF